MYSTVYILYLYKSILFYSGQLTIFYFIVYMQSSFSFFIGYLDHDNDYDCEYIISEHSCRHCLCIDILAESQCLCIIIYKDHLWHLQPLIDSCGNTSWVICDHPLQMRIPYNKRDVRFTNVVINFAALLIYSRWLFDNGHVTNCISPIQACVRIMLFCWTLEYNDSAFRLSGNLRAELHL